MTTENLNKGNNNFEYTFLTTCNPNKDTNIHNDYGTKTFKSTCNKIHENRYLVMRKFNITI